MFSLMPAVQPAGEIISHHPLQRTECRCISPGLKDLGPKSSRPCRATTHRRRRCSPSQAGRLPAPAPPPPAQWPVTGPVWRRPIHSARRDPVSLGTQASRPLYFPRDPVNHLSYPLPWCDSFQAIFCPVSAQWLVSGEALPRLLNVMSHSLHVVGTPRSLHQSWVDSNNKNRAKKWPSRGWSCPGPSQPYFKTLICIFLDGDDSTGLCHFALFAFSSGGTCESNAGCEVNMCFKNYSKHTWLFGGHSPFLMAPPFCSLLPVLFSSCDISEQKISFSF